MNDDSHTETQPRPNISTEPGQKGGSEVSGTDTQPAPNVSTEHQKTGDARDPSDTLDRGQEGPPGSLPQEKVEDRPNVSQVSPEDYPKDLPDH